MNIGDSHYNLNIGSAGSAVNGVGGRTELIADAKSQISGNAQITQVDEGEMFRGQILDITNGQVSIMLQDSKTLTAHMADAVNLNIGDLLTFMVKENNGTNVVIKPINEQADVMKNSVIFKVLEQNNFSPTAKNYQIAETLMNNGMSVDRAGMQRIMQQAYKYSDTSIDTLVALNKLGIPVNDGSIAQYEAYMSNNHQIMKDLMNMSNAVGNFSFEQISAMGSSADILEFNASLLGIISDSEDMQQMNVFGTMSDIAAADNADISGTNNADIVGANNIDLATANDTDVPVEAYAKSGVSNTELLNELSGAVADRLAVDSKSSQQVFSQLMNMGFDINTLKTIMDGSDSVTQLLNNINSLLKNDNELISGLNLQDLKSFFLSDGYKELLNSSVKSKLSIDGEKMNNPKELDSLYAKMHDKAERLLEAFSGRGGSAGSQLSESAKGIQERLDFIQNLNQMYAYAQLPIRMSGNEMNSELFVYMNKRHMKEAKDDVSALLHLDMEHLGPTDVHVSFHGTSVHTRFYVEDEESARIIDEHMTMLEKAINDNGYSLTNEVITREPVLATTGNMVVDEMLGKDLEQSVKRYSFDVRM